MTKRYILSFLLLFASALSYCADWDFYSFAQSNTAVSASISAALEASLSSSAPSANAEAASAENSVVKITLKQILEVSDDKGNFNTLKSRKECAAVAIGGSFLLASKTCTVTDKKIKHYAYQGAGNPYSEDYYNVDYKIVEDFRLITQRGDSYGIETVKDLGGAYLLYSEKEEVKNYLSSLPKAGIFAADSNLKIKDFEGKEILVSRESYVFSVREYQQRQAETICSENKCIKVKYNFFHTDASAGDPLFVRTESGKDYLFAFNAAQNYSEKSQNKSREFRLIDSEIIQNLEKAAKEINPSAWLAINKRIIRSL